MSKNYYEILGVGRDSSQDNIKKAYKSLSRKYHPDISKENNAEEMMSKINAAYDILSDSDKRIDYDSELDFFENNFYQSSNIYNDETEFSYNDSIVTKVMSGTTVVLGILFGTCSIIAYSVLNFDEFSSIVSNFFNHSILDIALLVIASLFVCVLLYYMSYVFVYSLVLGMAISLSLEYDSVIIIILIVYVGIYLSLYFILGADQEVLRGVGLAFLLIFLFSDYILNNFVLLILIAGLIYSIVITVQSFGQLMEAYSIEYVGVSHILKATILLPIIGGALMFIAYAVEEGG